MLKHWCLRELKTDSLQRNQLGKRFHSAENLFEYHSKPRSDFEKGNVERRVERREKQEKIRLKLSKDQQSIDLRLKYRECGTF